MFGQQRPIKMDFIKKNYNNQSVSGVLELNTHTHTKWKQSESAWLDQARVKC